MGSPQWMALPVSFTTDFTPDALPDAILPFIWALGPALRVD